MSDWRRVRLDEESELDTFAVRRGTSTLALGVGAWAVAASCLVAGAGWLEVSPGVVALFVAPLLALGAGWVVVGVRAIVRERRRRRWGATRPGEPWLSDYPWRPPVVGDRAGSQLVALFARLALGLACGAPVAFGLWMVGERGAAIVLALATIAAGGIGIGYTGRRALRWLRQGTSELELASFPAFPGQDLRATYRPGRRIAVPGALRVTLRFVAESHEVGEGPGRTPDVDVVCHRLYQDRREVGVPGASIGPKTGVELSIPLPAGALERGWLNTLSERPANYWQLLVETTPPGKTVRSVFFVPVYPPGENDKMGTC